MLVLDEIPFHSQETYLALDIRNLVGREIIFVERNLGFLQEAQET